MKFVLGILTLAPWIWPSLTRSSSSTIPTLHVDMDCLSSSKITTSFNWGKSAEVCDIPNSASTIPRHHLVRFVQNCLDFKKTPFASPQNPIYNLETIENCSKNFIGLILPVSNIQYLMSVTTTRLLFL